MSDDRGTITLSVSNQQGAIVRPLRGISRVAVNYVRAPLAWNVAARNSDNTTLSFRGYVDIYANGVCHFEGQMRTNGGLYPYYVWIGTSKTNGYYEPLFVNTTPATYENVSHTVVPRFGRVWLIVGSVEDLHLGTTSWHVEKLDILSYPGGVALPPVVELGIEPPTTGQRWDDLLISLSGPTTLRFQGNLFADGHIGFLFGETVNWNNAALTDNTQWTFTDQTLFFNDNSDHLAIDETRTFTLDSDSGPSFSTGLATFGSNLIRQSARIGPIAYASPLAILSGVPPAY